MSNTVDHYIGVLEVVAVLLDAICRAFAVLLATSKGPAAVNLSEALHPQLADPYNRTAQNVWCNFDYHNTSKTIVSDLRSIHTIAETTHHNVCVGFCKFDILCETWCGFCVGPRLLDQP